MGDFIQDASNTAASGTKKGTFERTSRMDLAVGTKILVRFGFAGAGSSEVVGELVGFSHYDFLILRFSPAPGLLAKITPGSLMTARFMHEGSASLFQAEVISHSVKPNLLVFATYPSTVNTMQVRKSERIPVALPGLLYTEHGDGYGYIRDLSKGGCRMLIDVRGQNTMKQLEANMAVHLKLALSPDTIGEITPATIKSIQSERFRVELGIAFDLTANDSSVFSSSLADYLEGLQNISKG